jgi:type II secretory pathway component GspD/PulD (secretin)
VLGVLSNSQKTSIRMGIQVPVTTTVFGSKSDGGQATTPQISYSYRDLGTNIDCQAQPAGDGYYSLSITTEDSSIHLDPSADSAESKSIRRDIPAFRSFRASFATVLRDGQSMQYVSATDPLSGESMRIDVMLTLAK